MSFATWNDFVEVRDSELVPARESGVHPTARCLEAGESLRAALLLFCDDQAPRERVWSILPIPRKPR